MNKGCFFNKYDTYVWIVLILFLIPISVNASITVEPNGVISYGTTLTIRLSFTTDVSTVGFEIVLDENNNGFAENSEKRMLVRTPVKVGGGKGGFKVHGIVNGRIEIYLRITSVFNPGSYVMRFFPCPDCLPESVVIEIAERRGWLSDWIRFFRNINDPAPSLQMVRTILKEGNVKKTNLWLMNSNFEISPLTHTDDCLNPHWSPDGKRIAYVRWIEGRGQLWILTMEEIGKVSTAEKLPVNIEGSILNPLWSHNGDKIAFLSGNDLWVVNADGSKPKKLTQVVGVQKILAWSPNDSYLVLSASPVDDTFVLEKVDNVFNIHTMEDLTVKPEDRCTCDMWKVDSDTGKRERLAYDISWQWLAYISGDRSKLVFPIKITSTEYELWLREGEYFKIARKLSKERFMDVDPSWTSDGRWVVFVSNRQKRE